MRIEMKGKLFFGAVLLFFSVLTAHGQESGAVMDSTLRGRNVFSVMPSRQNGGKADVQVNQTKSLQEMLSRHISSNESRSVTCYRVRIFNDNSQSARGASEAVLAAFSGAHPGYPVYRSYTNPFFKVTVGDFRTKSEALQLLGILRAEYPSAFLVKETVRFPWLGPRESYLSENETIVKR